MINDFSYKLPVATKNNRIKLIIHQQKNNRLISDKSSTKPSKPAQVCLCFYNSGRDIEDNRGRDIEGNIGKDICI